jgi:putative SOS response-associated peptidase YedK
MCGRYAQFKPRRDYLRFLRAKARDEIEERPSYNIAPSTMSFIALQDAGTLILDRLTWGLHGRTGLVSNARIETAPDKPTFSAAWRNSRGVVPVDGWFEWMTTPNGRKQPFYFSSPTDEPVLLAALIDRGRYTLLTSETHGPLRAVHTRRPAAIPLAAVDDWCDPKISWTSSQLEAALVAEDVYSQIPVGREVNSSRCDGAHLIEKRKPELSQSTLL